MDRNATFLYNSDSESPETCPCFGKTTSKFGVTEVHYSRDPVNRQHISLRNLLMLVLLYDGNIP